jgi:hypothetical protein
MRSRRLISVSLPHNRRRVEERALSGAERPLFDHARDQQLAEEGGSMGPGAGRDAQRGLERHTDTVENGLPVGQFGKEKSGKDADAGLARGRIRLRKTDG